MSGELNRNRGNLDHPHQKKYQRNLDHICCFDHDIHHLVLISLYQLLEKCQATPAYVEGVWENLFQDLPIMIILEGVQENVAALQAQEAILLPEYINEEDIDMG